MRSLFDDVVVFLGRSRSVEGLAKAFDIASTEATRVGVVLAVPAVLANLNRWVEDPMGAAWLSAYLADVKPSGPANFDELAAAYDLEKIGRPLLETILGDRREVVDQSIADRSELSPTDAGKILTATATTVLVQLAGSDDGSGGGAFSPAALTSKLADEHGHLVDGGWEPWIVETTAPTDEAKPDKIDADEIDARPDDAVEPHEAQLEGGDEAAVESADPASIDDDDPSDLDSASTTVQPLSDPPSDATVAPVPDQKQPSRRVLIGLLLLAAALLLAFFLTRSGDGSNSVSGGDTDSASPSVDTSSADEDDADGTSGDESSDSETSAEGTPTGESTDSATGESNETTGDDLVNIVVVMDDPLERTAGTGDADLTFDRATGEICFVFGVDGVANPYDGHIHVGPPGVKGGIVVDFEELVGSPSGCFENSVAGTNAILDDLSGHYVEFHDPDGVSTVRAQLAVADASAGGADSGSSDGSGSGTTAGSDDESGGAVIVIEPGAVVLRGDVPDQITIDKLIESFADIDFGATTVVDELSIVPGAPRPSGTILVGGAVLFDFDSDQLKDSDSTVLNDLATIFRARPAWSMVVVGHTDSAGLDVYNLELSLRRANAVKDALVSAGVDPAALTIEGAGATDPIADNATLEGRIQNRRIEFEVIAG